MADKVDFKMFSIILFIVFISNVSFSVAESDAEEKCNCYNICAQNFTLNSVYDVPKVAACQRGCRYFTLSLHRSHEPSPAKSFKKSREDCVLSCDEAYQNPQDKSACQFGCHADEITKTLCNPVQPPTPVLSYSFLIEESDILIHPGEPEPDDSLTDPTLRQQIQKTLAALLDVTPKIPEIRFRNLPVKTEKMTEVSQTSFKCPKIYGLDANFEFRNGKIIIGDLYLFMGVLFFVVLCFLISHHFETRSLRRQLLEASKDDFCDKEPLLKVDIHQTEVKENFPEKSEILYPPERAPEPFGAKFEEITLVFHDGEEEKENNMFDSCFKI